MPKASSIFSVLMLCGCSLVYGQDYSQRGRLTVNVEYANTSSHILLGISQNRRIAGLDFGLSRRLLRTRFVDWSYDVVMRPIVLVQDPTSVSNYVLTSNGVAVPGSSVPVSIQRACVSNSVQGPGYVITQTCGTRWTYAGGFSPLGQRFNFAPRHRLQPLAGFNGGLVVATRNIPADNAARLNFTFEFGAGLEYFRDSRHSITAGYVVQHLSNGYRGESNPGIDSQIVRVGYSFGR